MTLRMSQCRTGVGSLNKKNYYHGYSTSKSHVCSILYDLYYCYYLLLLNHHHCRRWFLNKLNDS